MPFHARPSSSLGELCPVRLHEKTPGFELWTLSHAPLSFIDCVLYPFTIAKHAAEYSYTLGPVDPSSESRGGTGASDTAPLAIPLSGFPKREASWILLFRARQAVSMDPVP